MLLLEIFYIALFLALIFLASTRILGEKETPVGSDYLYL